MTLSEASLKQIEAAQPQRSTWLSANAGSGKTRVLTDRVARLLLDGVDPQNILCLTYTKAAAAEMQNRLFNRLGEWAMKPDEALRAELAELGVMPDGAPDFFARARRLFAQAVETPGGLRIQTIHSFCASLLRRFPREAGVTPAFQELDDRTAAQLRERVADEMALSEERSIFLEMAKLLGGNDLGEFTAELVSKQAQFAQELTESDAKIHLGLKSEMDTKMLLSEVFQGGEIELLEKLKVLLAGAGPADQKKAPKLEGIRGPTLFALPVLESIFLYGTCAKAAHTAKVGAFPSQKSIGLVPELEALTPELNALMLRVEDARPKRIALAAAQAAAALNAFGRAFLSRYFNAKEAHGWLDFDDLISRAKHLLTDDKVAAWVLYRLDGGIDHILVDEAQDTSPEQWAVIERLAQEITAGQGTHEDRKRTIFVVGDRKQSIYSFQGADASEFERMRIEFEARLKHHEKPLLSTSLEFSFRSSRAVLELVDQIFAGQSDAGFDANAQHKAFFGDMPGRVDIWPVVEKLDKPDDPAWYDPVDVLSPSDPVVVLAEQVASYVKAVIDAKTLLPIQKTDDGWQGRPVHEGDFLILFQRRSRLFHEVIHACKAKGLEIAGADRLRINEELAVKDLTALLRFLETPEDDLSLAAVLRSPLFGWTEQQLFTLAAHRGGRYLWDALRGVRDEHPVTLDILSDLDNLTNFLRPYELIDRMLTRHNGRKRLLERLGHEAEEAIDAFLSLALTYERSAVPSLTGFLSWLSSDDPEIKRQVEGAGKSIRVMTVHGSKGLEAPIVIMPDTANRDVPVRGQVVPSQDTAFFAAPADQRPPLLQEAYEALKRRQEEERQRLLYVSMTRAEKWLIIAAAGEASEGKSWYHSIAEAAAQMGAYRQEEYGQKLTRFEVGDWSGFASTYSNAKEQVSGELEPFLRLPAVTPQKALKPLNASSLPGEKALGSEREQDREAAMAHGTEVHMLLETLPLHPEEHWPEISTNLGVHAAAIIEAQSVLKAPELLPLFAEATLSEITLTAPSSVLGRRLHGIADKLIIGEDEVAVIDFKTNPTVPERAEDCPVGLLRQMGAYLEALEQIYPGKTVKAAILWTARCQLMPLDHDLVMRAYKDPTYLDALPRET